jgi:hypothetical protein
MVTCKEHDKRLGLAKVLERVIVTVNARQRKIRRERSNGQWRGLEISREGRDEPAKQQRGYVSQVFHRGILLRWFGSTRPAAVNKTQLSHNFCSSFFSLYATIGITKDSSPFSNT